MEINGQSAAYEPDRKFRNVTLEMSLKPFKNTDDDYVRNICVKAYRQWERLIGHADAVSVMLWCADGSEILEYKRRMDEEFEWAMYIGGANPRQVWNRKADPEGIGLHTRNYLYTEKPPVFTYGKLKRIIEIIKETGMEFTGGKPVKVGETFDPGPEFAKSDFKYIRHNEICLSNTMGKSSFVCSYGVLKADKVPYAGFPDGIPEGTPFGTFLGRQCRFFLKDMGFDFLWFSNGLGFGADTWSSTGALFDGERFDCGRFGEISRKVLDFWKLFRMECPDIRIETRGTNMTAGIDLATDGVPLKDIYGSGFNLLPPPNSPWAALNGDFGLELAGYMSRMAELPADEYLFRFYVHDPWWQNSPWIDRYEGQPHDIYLPMAVSRIGADGRTANPTHLNILTIDNSYGDMPDSCPDESIPHILKALMHSPDAPSPVIWAYPFDEYHKMAGRSEESIREVFFGDWFIRSAINNGFPLGTVISTGNFTYAVSSEPKTFMGSVVAAIIPDAGSDMEKACMEFIKSGGRMIFYGPVRRAGKAFMKMLNLAGGKEPLSGEIFIDVAAAHSPAGGFDILEDGRYPGLANHRDIICAGPIDTVLEDEGDRATTVLASAAGMGGSGSSGGNNGSGRSGRRVIALYREDGGWRGGAVAWVRGTSANSYRKGAHLLTPDDPSAYFAGESLMRHALDRFGITVAFAKSSSSVKNPVIMVHRSDNAFYFSGYMPDTTASIRLRFPLGAPLLIGSETKVTEGVAEYCMPRAWHSECRIFVGCNEGSGTISCREMPPVSYYVKRRLKIDGLKNATIRIYPEKYCSGTMALKLNAPYPHIVSEPYNGRWLDDRNGIYYEATGLCGTAMVEMPFDAAAL